MRPTRSLTGLQNGALLTKLIVAKEILRSIGLYDRGVTIISCPTCSRAALNLTDIVDFISLETGKINKKMKIAIMGCSVNGPGEAKEADFGIAGVSPETFSFFKKGERVANYARKEAIDKLLTEIQNY